MSMTIIEFMSRVAAVTAKSGIRPYMVRMSDGDIAELQAEVAVKAASVSHEWEAGHMVWPDPIRAAEVAVMRLDCVYILRGADADPVWL